MTKLRIGLIFGFLLYFSPFIQSQIIWLKPENPRINDSVTLFYDATKGNGVLKNLKGNLYLHTGVITNRSLDGHDWKYVVGNWGTDDKRVLMTRESENLYTYRFVISQMYKLNPDDVAQQLAYVFRNQDGTLVGKTVENEDITIPVNGYKQKATTEILSNKEEHKLISLVQNANSWEIEVLEGKIRIQPFTEQILEVTYLPAEYPVADASHSVVLEPQKLDLRSKQTDYGYALSCGKMQIAVTSEPLKLAFIYAGDTLAKEESGFFYKPGNSGIRFALHTDEKIYGAGERAMPMDRRGKKLQLYNRPFYAYEMGAAMLNYSLPLTFSSRNYGILFDNPQKGYVDIGNTDINVQEWSALGGTPRYYVIAGKQFSEVVSNYTLLTGRQSLPPRWVFGNLQSRMAYRNQAETENIVNLMQKNDFPIDAIILDFYWFGDSIQGHLGKLDWFKPAWPEPQKMISDFKAKGIKTILITEPYVIDTVANHKEAAAKGVFVTDSLGRTYLDKQFYFGTGSLIDIFKPEARDWFWSKYDKQIKYGVAAWWGDLGEPESHPSDIYHVNGKADQVHNIYGHYWDKMLFEKYAENYPSTRLFHLQRSGFAGSQRYSAFPWTGDVSRSWGGLQAQLPLLLTMSISGLGYIHSDAGGFAQGLRDDELYTRWLQFAVFTPILRPHGSNFPSEPVFWSAKTQEIVRKYMKLRYALLPYNYTLAWQNSQSGTPLMRPLLYSFSTDEKASLIEDQYMWGDNLLIAPVIKKGIEIRSIYLPEGNWYDFNSGKLYSGNTSIQYPLSLDEIPVFAKAGCFIPMTKPLNTTDNYKADNYTIRFYPGKNTTYLQYEDNGLDNHALAEEKFEIIEYTAAQKGNDLVITMKSTGNWPGKPDAREITLEIRSDSKNATLTLEKIATTSHKKKRKTQRVNVAMDNVWLKVNFSWDNTPVQLTINNFFATK